MKKFIKNNLKVFVTMIITTIIVGSVSVYAASQYFAKDISFTPTNENFKKENGEAINNVEEALNELYNKNNDYNSKNYTTEGLNVFDNRVEILNGGYYIDNNGVTWVNITFKVNTRLREKDSWLLIYGLPTINKQMFVTSSDNKYNFTLKPDNGSGNYNNSITYYDYYNIPLDVDTVITLRFKY